jgi:hypothetical protein
VNVIDYGLVALMHATYYHGQRTILPFLRRCHRGNVSRVKCFSARQIGSELSPERFLSKWTIME